MDSFLFSFSTLFSLVGVAVVILLAYWTSRYLAKHYSTLAQGKYMRILDRIVIGQDKYLVLVETAGIVLLLGVAGSQIKKLGQLRPDDLEEHKNPIPRDFAGTLSEVIKKKFSPWHDREPGEGGNN